VCYGLAGQGWRIRQNLLLGTFYPALKPQVGSDTISVTRLEIRKEKRKEKEIAQAAPGRDQRLRQGFHFLPLEEDYTGLYCNDRASPAPVRCLCLSSLTPIHPLCFANFSSCINHLGCEPNSTMAAVRTVSVRLLSQSSRPLLPPPLDSPRPPSPPVAEPMPPGAMETKLPLSPGSRYLRSTDGTLRSRLRSLDSKLTRLIWRTRGP
jgi:hypothetical protein